MQFTFSDKLKPILYSLIMAVILFISIGAGIGSGFKHAQSLAVIESVNNLQTGLNYFYNDQDRFPTAVEFSDQVIMSNYFKSFPPINFAGSCPQNYIYKRNSDINFELDFCLPTSSGNFKSGWNLLSGKK